MYPPGAATGLAWRQTSKRDTEKVSRRGFKKVNRLKKRKHRARGQILFAYMYASVVHYNEGKNYAKYFILTLKQYLTAINQKRNMPLLFTEFLLPTSNLSNKSRPTSVSL